MAKATQKHIISQSLQKLKNSNLILSTLGEKTRNGIMNLQCHVNEKSFLFLLCHNTSQKHLKIFIEKK